MRIRIDDRRSWASVAMVYLFGIAATFGAVHSWAQNYPGKPIRMIVGFAPGGGTDIVARLVSKKLSEYLRQSVYVENRPGASGTIGIERTAKSPADGYTLLMQVTSSTIPSALYTNLPYDLERDLGAVSLVAIGPFLLVVHPSVPARNVRELIALARARPGKLNYGSSGNGSAAHLATGLFSWMAKVNIVHVPYKGGGDSLLTLISGQIDVLIVTMTAVTPFISSGKVRALAVTTAERTSLMPGMPTISESGLPGYDRASWYGILAPAGLPKNIVTQLNAAIGNVVNMSDTKQLLNNQGLEPRTSTPEQLETLIHNDMVQNVKLVKMIGLKAE